MDLSNNYISQDASKMFFNISPNIEVLILSSNSIRGNLLDPFQLNHLIRYNMSDNDIDGNLPDFPGSTPLLRELDLSNQKRALLRELDLSNQKRANGRGLVGTI